MNKDDLRREMRERRRALPIDEQRAAAQAVFSRLLAFEPYAEAKCMMAYAAARGELSLAPVLEHVLDSGKVLLMPRCESRGMMTARRIMSLDRLVHGTYDLMEPSADSEMADPSQLDLILVPGVAFDRAGNRLGQGAGYYDRFLKKMRALRVGVCHDFSLLERVPFDKHDARMDFVITPGGVIRTGANTMSNRRT